MKLKILLVALLLPLSACKNDSSTDIGDTEVKIPEGPGFKLGYYQSTQENCRAKVFWYAPNPNYVKFTIYFSKQCGEEYQGYMMGGHNYLVCEENKPFPFTCLRDDSFFDPGRPLDAISKVEVSSETEFTPVVSDYMGLKFHWVKALD